MCSQYVRCESSGTPRYLEVFVMTRSWLAKVIGSVKETHFLGEWKYIHPVFFTLMVKCFFFNQSCKIWRSDDNLDFMTLGFSQREKSQYHQQTVNILSICILEGDHWCIIKKWRVQVCCLVEHPYHRLQVGMMLDQFWQVAICLSDTKKPFQSQMKTVYQSEVY